MAKNLNDTSYDKQAIETYWRARWEADGLWDIDIDNDYKRANRSFV